MVKVIERNKKKIKKERKRRERDRNKKREKKRSDSSKKKNFTHNLMKKSTSARPVNSLTKNRKLISWLCVAFYFYSFIHSSASSSSYGVGFHQSVIIISLIGCDVFFCCSSSRYVFPRFFFTSPR